MTVTRTELVLHPVRLESSRSPVKEVQIWKAQVDSCSSPELETLKGYLDSEENARATRFRFTRDQRNYIATRGLLRSLLGTLLHEDPAKLAFQYGKHGKPALKHTGSSATVLRFNVSHSNGWALFAISKGLEVGIDLESVDRLKRSEDNLMDLAARILSKHELNTWQALPDSGRPNAFLRAWTRKEAYAKATGRGLFDRLSSIEVALDAAAPESSLRLSISGQDWVVHDLWAPDGFAAALALEQPRIPHGGTDGYESE